MKKKRLDVRTMAYLAMFIGLTTVLSLLGEFMPIQMPQGGLFRSMSLPSFFVPIFWEPGKG